MESGRGEIERGSFWSISDWGITPINKYSESISKLACLSSKRRRSFSSGRSAN